MRYAGIPGWPTLPPGVTLGDVVSIAVDSLGEVWVFHRGDPPMLVFDESGRFLRSWGTGLFERPHGLTIGPDDSLYCTDDFGHSVHKFTRDGKLVWTLGERGKPSDTGLIGFDYRTIRGGGPFHFPTNVALGADGTVYVSDGYGNARVHVFTAAGEYVRSWGEPGEGPGQFNVPHAVTVDTRGRVIVCDRENSRMQFFSPEGEFLEQWTDVARPSDIWVDRDGLLYVPEVGFQAGIKAWPWKVAGWPGGRMTVFTPDGDIVARWGGGRNPMSPDDFFAPHDVWGDGRGSLYVGEVARVAGCAEAGYPDAPLIRKFRLV